MAQQVHAHILDELVKARDKARVKAQAKARDRARARERANAKAKASVDLVKGEHGRDRVDGGELLQGALVHISSLVH